MKPIQTNKGSERSFSQRCVCNKKGIELSVTYLVLLILMIAILGFAFVAVSKMLGSSKESVEAIQARMERQTEQLLTDTNRVSVPIDTQEVAPGELALFSVGVMNVLSSMDMFELNLEFKEAYTENRTPITIAPEQAMSWISSVELNQDVKIKQIEKHVFLIGVQPPVTAQKGSYVYNVEIWYDKTMDGVVTDPDLEVGFHKDDHYPRSPKKITVEVK